MREIKFKAWHPTAKIMSMEFTLMDAMEHEVDKTSDDEIHLQFTGLIDCQGVEIYEGDVVHQPFSEWVCTEAIGTIVFKDAKFLFTDNEGRSSFSIQSNVEVIGNIYENPKLLNKEVSDEPAT